MSHTFHVPASPFEQDEEGPFRTTDLLLLQPHHEKGATRQWCVHCIIVDKEYFQLVLKSRISLFSLPLSLSHTQTHTYIHLLTCTFACAQANAREHTRFLASALTRMLVRARTHTYTHTQTHTYTHKHTPLVRSMHTCTLSHAST